MAEGLMRKALYELGKADIEVASAGVRALTGLSPTEETVAAMKEEDIDVSALKTKNVTAEMIRRADLILVMEPVHRDEIIRMAPKAASKTFLLKEYGNPEDLVVKGWSVNDPIGKPIEDYRLCRDEIDWNIDRIARSL